MRAIAKVWPAAPLMILIFLSGCFEDDATTGPLTMRLADVNNHEPGNFTLHLVYTNMGDEPLTRMETWWDATIRSSNGTARDWAESEIRGAYGEWNLSTRPRGIFNETEALAPGAEKHANISVSYPPPGNELRAGEVYAVIASATYEDPQLIYRWKYFLPCIGSDGTPVAPAACDSWVPFYTIEK